MKFRYLNGLLLIIFILLFINIFKVWYQLQNKSSIMHQTAEALEDIQNERESLKRDLAKVESWDYVEREARNKLNLIREGEVVVFMPSCAPVAKLSPTPTQPPYYWVRWLRVFTE